MKKARADAEDLWDRHSAEWRDTGQITSQWREAASTDFSLLRFHAHGDWWGILEELGITLFVSREYEHLVLGFSSRKGRRSATFFPVPHPSGLVVDRRRRRLYLASTRNPNQIYVMGPITGLLERRDSALHPQFANPMTPLSTAFYPGSLYIHDLALIDGRLYANAVGHNAVARLDLDGGFRRVWWPKCIEQSGKPIFEQNHIQLNSIAAGKTVRDSYYSASSCVVGRLRPGHLKYKVDHQGVVFSGLTREPICSGLTRPHSARLTKGSLWVANSGYGQLVRVSAGKLDVVCTLPGWTRGLTFSQGMAFIATSRVIPRYSRYAPGLDCHKSRCAVYAVCVNTGRVVGSIEWPLGNQVFAIDWIDSSASSGFAFDVGRRRSSREVALFYRYLTDVNSGA